MLMIRWTGLAPWEFEFKRKSSGARHRRICIHRWTVSEVDDSCRLLIVPLFRGSSSFESLILSRHSRFTCECNKEDINDDDDDHHSSSDVEEATIVCADVRVAAT